MVISLSLYYLLFTMYSKTVERKSKTIPWVQTGERTQFHIASFIWDLIKEKGKSK